LIRNKTIVIALLMMLSLPISLSALPPANAAQVQRTYNSYTFAATSAVGGVIGIDQTLNIFVWEWTLPPNTLDEAARGGVAAGALPSWHGFTVNIVQPDGSNKTLGPLNSDSVGSTYTSFKPDQLGTYIIQGFFPGEFKNTTGYDTYYLPSHSAPVTVTVQKEAIGVPSWPLPTEYWERPINYENQEWWQIGGNWLGTPLSYGAAFDLQGRYNPYTTAPNTAHIVWTKPIGFGGVAGGDFPDNPGVSYYTGVHYEARMSPTVAINGVMFYNLPKNTERNTGGTVAVDIRTGEQLWYQNITITMGQVLDFESPNQHGVISYLWYIASSGYKVYDPNTGNLLYQYTNVTGSGTVTTDDTGSILIYMIGGTYPNRWMALWNSTYSPGNYQGAGTATYDTYSWRPTGKTIDWKTGIQWNKTFTGVSGNPSITKLSAPHDGDPMFIWRNAYTQSDGSIVQQDMGFDLQPGKELNVLWGPVNQTAKAQSNTGPMRSGVYTEYISATRQWYGYDAKSGRALWGPSEVVEDQFAQYGGSADVFLGALYYQNYGGTIYAFNLTTGATMWVYNDTVNSATPYGHNPFWEGIFGGDGKVFACTYEHSQNNPPYKGAKIYAINATTGKLVWDMLGWYQGFGAVNVDGYLAIWMLGDNQEYCFGKGQTAVTAAVSPAITAAGNYMLLQGTVTDQSPGEKVKGTPAIADENMTAWMEYIYQQKPRPQNVTGVPVSIDAIDPNNNHVHLGDTISDSSGFYSYAWETPNIPGKYTIIATFGGSEAYFASSTETAAIVTETSAATVAPTQMPQSIADLYFVPATIGIIIAIIIVGALVVLMVRKRP
jgi:outer membrane protein assembly factor BamB